MQNNLDVHPITLSTKTARVGFDLRKISKHKKKLAALSSSQFALILSACGSSDDSSSSNLLTLTKSADTYSASNVTGFSLLDSSSAKIDVADATSNTYEVKLDASGAGVLEFDFADAGDTVTLLAGSKTSGFTTLKVTDGTIDATNADLTGITRVEVASGIKISLAQVKLIPTIVANSATAEVSIEVATDAEAAELVDLVAAGTVTVYADTNPIKLVAASTATVTDETLTAKQTETATSVKPSAEAPADTATDTSTSTDTGSTNTDDAATSDTSTSTGTDTATSGGGGAAVDEPARFRLSSDPSGNYTVGNDTGTVTLTKADSTYTLSPATGTVLSVSTDLVTSFVVNGITMQGSASAFTGETVTGTGTVSITSDATDDANLTNIAATGFDFGSDNTVAVSAGKTLTLDADQAAVATSGITGAGNVTVEDDDATANSSLLITATGTVVVDAGTGNDTIDLGNAENVTAADSVDGGGGTDELQITADNGTTGAVLDDLVDIDTVTVEVSSTATDNAKVTLQYTSSNTDAMTIDATALTNSSAAFTLVASDAEVGGILTVNGGAGGDTITTGGGADIITGGAGADSMTGGGGNDTYVFAGTSEVASGEAITEASSGGTDRVKITADTDFANMTAASFDEIDQIEIVGAKTATLTGAQITGETIALLGGTGVQAVVVTATAGGTTDLSNVSAGTGWTAGTDTLTINGATTTDETIVGSSTNDVIDAKTGDDIVTGGAGADAIDVDAGTDQVIINAVVGTSSESSRVVVATSDDDDIGQDVIEAMTFGSGSDTIKIVATMVDSFVHGTDTDIGTGAGSGTDGDETSFTVLTGLVDLNQATDGNYKDAGDIVVSVKTGTSNFDETNFEAALVYSLTADTDGSTMTGGANADTITGGAGVDNITGGAGNDILSGGDGSDVYKFSTSNGTDAITFVAADDDLDFTGITPSGTLAETAVTNGAGAYTVTLDGTNSAVFVIDTDATDLDGTGTDDAIADFTSMTAVAAFLNAGGAGAVTASGTSGKKDVFIINDGSADAAYVYLFVDDGDGTTTVEETELSLLASLSLGSSEVVTVSEVTIS